jgi:hypothetical protein
MSYFINLILSQASVTSRAEIIRHLLCSALLSFSQYSNYEYVELISSVITKPYIFRLTDTFHLVHLTHSYEFRQFEEITSAGCRRHLKKTFTSSRFSSVEDSSFPSPPSSGFGSGIEGFGINSPHIPFFGNYFKSLKRCFESSSVIETFPFPPPSPSPTKLSLQLQPSEERKEREEETARIKLINLVVLRFRNDLLLEIERYQKIPYQFPICEIIQQQILFHHHSSSPEEIGLRFGGGELERDRDKFGFHSCDEEKFNQRSVELEPNKSSGSHHNGYHSSGSPHDSDNDHEEEEGYGSDYSESEK